MCTTRSDSLLGPKGVTGEVSGRGRVVGSAVAQDCEQNRRARRAQSGGAQGNRTSHLGLLTRDPCEAEYLWVGRCRLA